MASLFSPIEDQDAHIKSKTVQDTLLPLKTRRLGGVPADYLSWLYKRLGRGVRRRSRVLSNSLTLYTETLWLSSSTIRLPNGTSIMVVISYS